MSASAAHRDFAALQWVTGDIEKTAEQTVKELLGFADNVSDQTRLRYALTQSHQLHATLRLLDVPSAEQLAREIEDTLQGILHGDIEATDTLLQQLLSATLQLPGYLKRIASDRRESPSEVAPLINDLRRTRGEAPLELLSEGQEIDVSELQQGCDAQAAPATDEELQLLRRSRQRFQTELVGLLRGEAPLEKLRNLRRVFALLAEQTRPGGQRRFWEAAQAACEGLLEGGVEIDEVATDTIRDIDTEFRAEIALEHRLHSRAPDADLYRRLLELIAPSRPVSALLAEIQQRHHLLPPARGAGRPLDDLGAVGAAAEALGHELRMVLDRLEATEGDAFSVGRMLREVEPELRRITSMLNGLGYRHEHEILALQLGRADALALEGEDLEERLTEISAALLEVDQRLAARAVEAGGDAVQVESRRHPLQSARAALYREVQTGLERVKEVVSDYLTTDRDVALLGATARDFHALGGALRLAGLESADAVLAQCGRYVSEVGSGMRTAPDAQDIDRFADAISSVEYFVERLVVDSVPADLVLARAASSLHGLLQPQMAVEAPEPEPAAEAGSAQPESTAELAETEPPEPQSAQPEAAVEETAEAAPAQAVPEITEAEPETAEAKMVVEAAEVDPEIAEIFVEEVTEVLENVDVHFSLWQQTPVAGESLTEIRRAFHTLKGSGRMVGAGIIGELAWSIENLLNRVIDAAVQVSPAVIEAVDRARKMIPDLVEAFAKAAPVNVSAVSVVQEAAHALARNEAVQWPAVGMDVARAPAPTEHVVEQPAEEAPEFEAGEAAEAAAEAEPTEPAPGTLPAEVAEPSEAGVEALEVEPSAAEPEAEEPAEPAAEAEAEDWLPELEPEELARAQEAAAEHEAPEEAAAEAAAPGGVEDWLPELEPEELAGELEEPTPEAVEAELEAEDWLPELEPEELARAQAPEDLPQETPQPEQVEDVRPEAGAEEPALAARVAQEEVAASGPEIGAPFDPRLLAIFREEMGNHLRQLRDFLDGNAVVGESQTRTLHTLRGSAHVAGAKAIGMAADRVDEVIRAAALAGRPLDAPEVGLLGKFTDLLEKAVAAEDPNGAALQATARELAEEAAELAAAATEAAGATGEPGIAARVARFLEDALERLFHASKLAESWISGEAGARDRRQLLEELAGIHQRAAQIELQSIVALSAPLLEATSAAARGEEEATESLFELLRRGLDALMDLLDCLAAGQLAPAPAVLIGELESYCASREARAEASEAPVPEAAEAASLDLVRARVGRELAQSEPELLDVFMDEAEELMAGIDEAIEAWRHDRWNREYFDTLQRQLHTLKGGARMAGLKFLGDLSHNFETLVINQDLHFGSFDDAFFARVSDLHEQLLRTMDVVRTRPAPEEAAPAVVPAQGLPAEPVSPPPPAVEPGKLPQPLEPLAEIPAPVREPAVPSTTVSVIAARLPVAPTAEKPAAKPRDEVVRVSAQLLEELVNLAGETSISRARVEEQVSELGYMFDEMQSTLERLQNQIRRLDIATEAQILFRRERAEHAGHEGFDPLEMDRYSQLQQLARSLVESSSDLLDIKRTLAEKTGDVETVLVQQARINSQLQEGLMRSRMVPFANILPRLRRVVRQVSGELGKQVELELANVSGELDRGILERVVAPLEHMLRNAVDHGVESVEKRRAIGKPEVGRIELEVAREGGEVVISLADDGAGVDLEAVRRRALDRGLIAPEVEPSRRDLVQLILHSGFSTAEKVTQISGRGVGLDVVNSEIRQMGGALEIQTDPGKGSRFIVRLPFTVSVSRALMVGVAGETYAIPLNTVQGVVRIRRDERSHDSDPNAAILQYAGDHYKVRHLGSLLFPGERFDASDLEDTIPVVLVRGGGQALAVEVDRLVGAREIVVKGLGPQFGAVSGLSGATVLGDGSVVVILDIPAMLRADSSLGPQVAAAQAPAPAAQAERTKRAPLIMVVDDSVTVRKVTTRFLEREGLRVVTAKDGAEAMVKLQEFTPDLMLLDIEMPHMDGFEVISKVRLSERFRELPIIMITSRTGEKHRERALSLGANDYMGKPYQEAVLMKSINDLLHRDDER